MRWIALFITLFSTSPLLAIRFSDLNMGRLNREMLEEKKELSGHWASGETWKGFLCKGEYRYTADLKGKLADLKMEVAEEKTAEIRAEFTDVRGSAFGSYRTSKFLCLPFHLGINFLIDRVSVYAKAFLIDDGFTSKIKVQVVSTRLGPVHLGKAVSPAIETFVTRLLNSAFRWVWDSRFGVWINQRITEEVNKQAK